jgi:hypothetical protein
VRRRWAETLHALALVALFWLVVPYQQSRFLFPLFGVLAISIGAAAAQSGRVIQGLLLAAPLAGAAIAAPMSLASAALAAGAVAGLAALALPPRAVGAIGALAALALAIGTAEGFQRYRERGPGYRAGPQLAEAWAWLYEHVRGARIAWAGSHLAYPLWGRDFANHVRYVNVALGPDAKLHDFAAHSGPAHSAEPAIYREGASPQTWVANLRQLRMELVFVSAMHFIVRREIASDAEGFPVERTWADALPDVFRLRWSNEGVRIYELAPEPAPGAAPAAER